MSSSIDNRVVVLSFDNKDFERNVQTSLGTLDKLKKGLEFNGATDGLSKIAASAKTFDLSPMGTAIENIQNRFSTLGIIGMTVLQNLTNKAVDFASKTFGQIVSGGIKRALNFEQAEFQLEGLLGKVEGGQQKIDEIMTAANNAVSGTAYGLDEAAKAASQLVASGIQDGQQMEFVLKGIAGTAAMTGSSYTDMADIFTTVAGNGKLMTEQLRQFSHRGLNVAATLAEQLGTTEEEVREMVKAGAIDFETFSTAMSDAFGEHAQAANKTFTGSLSNVRAALSRLGAKVATPALEHLRDIFNVLGPMIDAVSAALDPFINLLKNGMEGAARIGVKAITTLYMALGGDVDKLRTKTEYMSDEAKNAMNTAINNYGKVAEIFDNLREAFKRFGTAIGGAFKETFSGLFNVDFNSAIEKLKSFSEKLVLSDTAMEGLKRVIKAILAPIRLFLQLVGKIAPVIEKIAGAIGNGILNFLEFVGAADKVSLSAENLERKTRFLDSVSKIIHNVGEAFKNFASRLKDTWDVIKNSRGVRHLVSELKELWATIKQIVGDKIDKFLDFLERVSGKKLDLGNGAFSSFAYTISGLADKLANFIELIRTGENPIAKFFESIKKGSEEGGAANGFLGFITSLKDGLKEALKNALSGTGLTETFTSIKEGIMSALNLNIDESMKNTNFLENVKQHFLSFFDRLKELLAKVPWDTIIKNLGKIALIVGAFKLLTGLGGMFSSVGELISAFKTKMFGSGLTKAVNNFKSLAIAIGVIAGSMFVIAMIPTDRLKVALITIGIIMGAFVALTVAIDKLKLDTKKLRKFGESMLMVSISLGVLSIAMKSIAKMSTGDIVKSELAIAGIIAIFTIASKAMKNVKGGTASFALMALAIDLLIPAMLVFGNMKAEKLIKGGAAVLSLLMSMALASKVAKGAVGGAGAMAIMALAIDALIPAMLVFGNMKTSKLIQAGVAFEAFMVSLAAATKIASSAVGGAASMLLMAVSVDALIPAVLVFGNMDTVKLVQGGLAVVAMLTSLALASRIAQGSVKGAFAMLLMTVPLLAAGAALALLSHCDWKGMLAAGVALTGVMIALSVATKMASGNLVGATTLLAMTVPLLGAAAALAIVAQYDWKSILAAGASISGVILAISGAILLLQAVPIPGALMAIGSLAIFVGGLAGLMAGLGALAKYTSFGELISAGAGVFGQLGRGLGDFVGGIIEGVGESIANTLPKIGQGLSDFATNVQPFLDTMSTVDTKAVDGVANLAKAMLIITGTEFLESLTTGFGLFDSSAVRFGQTLAEFAPYLVDYSNAVSGIDESSVEASARAALMLADFAATIPNEGGLLAKVTGDNSLAMFAQELVPFGEALSAYSDSVSGIDEAAVTASAYSAQLISDFAKTIPNEGGLLAKIMGDNTLVQFAQGLAPFGVALSEYSDAVSGKIDEESVAASTRSAQLISDFAKTIPNEGGLLAEIMGDNDLTKFAQGLVPFGEAIATYSATVSGRINEAEVEASMRAAQMVSDFAATIPNEGGLLAKITGDNDLATFGAGLAAFGPSLAQYSTDIANIDDAKVSASASVAKMLADFAATVPKSGGFVQLVTGDNDLEQFGAELQAFGPSLAAYSESIANVNEESVAASLRAATMIADFYNQTLPTKGGLVGLFEGNPLVHFGEELQAFGPYIASYSSSVSGAIDENSVAASAGAAKILADMYTTITGAGITGGIEGLLKGNPLKKFGKELESFGPYLVSYGESIKGLNTSKIQEVNAIIQPVTEMTSVVNSASYDQIVSYAKALDDFGEKLKDYYDDIKDVSTAKISAVIKTTYDLINVGGEMANVETSAMGEFGEALGNIGNTGVDEFVAALENGTTAVSNAVTELVSSAASNATSGDTWAFYNIGVNMVNGMINGLADSAWAVYDTAANIANAAAQTIRNCLQIFSPSRVMYQIGEYTIEGMANGMADNLVNVSRQSEKAGETVLESVAKPLAELQNAIDDGLELDPVITPVLDLSSINQDAGMIDGIFGRTGIPISFGDLSGSSFDAVLGLANQIAQSQSSQESVVNAIGDLRSDINALGDRMSRMQLLLDGKTLVGGIIEDVDQALGDKLSLAQRGI